jgi:hypothetical protein
VLKNENNDFNFGGVFLVFQHSEQCGSDPESPSFPFLDLLDDTKSEIKVVSGSLSGLTGRGIA